MQIFFISGHMDLTQEMFDLHYKQKICELFKVNSNRFVVGDSKGVDFMAQQLLSDLINEDINKDYSRVSVYHIGIKPFNLANPKFKKVGGFKSHHEKDTAMTLNSNYDILYIRPKEETKKLLGDKYNPKVISGTEKNFNRRINMMKINK